MPTEFLPAGALVVWVLSAFAAGWLAGELGRNAFNGLLAGLLIGPLALLAIGFAGRGEGLIYKRCVECQELVPRAATTCPQCGTDLIVEGGAERRGAAAPDTTTANASGDAAKDGGS